MALKTVDQNPSITDTILFDILTPDANGCFFTNPYVVNSVTIYFVQRDFALGVPVQYNEIHYDPTLLANAQTAAQLACAMPTEQNIALAQQAQSLANAKATVTPVFYNEASAIQVVGNPDFPAWLSTDVGNAFITNVPTDAKGNLQYGHFQYVWNPVGNREGDYFICWTWTMLPAGTSMSAHTPFNLLGDTSATTSIPTHQTPPGKYQTLLERYLPNMFKMMLISADLTPTVLNNLNNAIAQGFTDLENLANQIVDLLDANVVTEAFLPLLGRLFNLKLKSNDPTLWRRQIKRAIPLAKSKGSTTGLVEAFAQAGMRMTKLTRMWQVVSQYTWQDQFNFDGNNTFLLTYSALTPDPNNFAVSIRHAADHSYSLVPLSYVTFEGDTVTWVGPSLVAGDSILVLYLTNAIPDNMTQLIENFIRTLPLADQRDERSQLYPLKNWNERVIEEDDPMFAIVIPDRQPYHADVVFGKIRTEFPYSENTYLMDEYNGSLRNSTNPCDIDRDFLDTCSQCRASKYTIDLEIENLSNERLIEAQQIISEATPFHAVLHSINFSGGIDEFLHSDEAIEVLVQYTGQEEVVAGGAQNIFGRAMFGGFDVAQVKRNVLANSEWVVNNASGTAYNDQIVMACDLVNFNDIGMDTDGTNVLEILAPSPLAGNYVLSSPQNHFANIAPIAPTIISEPISHSPFTFRLSNNVYLNSSATISQDNLIELTDPTVSFATLGVISDWNISHGQPGGPWKVLIPAYSATPFTIHEVMPDGGVIINYSPSLPSSNVTDVTYQLLTDVGAVVTSSSLGTLTVTKRALVDISNDPLMNNLLSVTRQGQWMLDITSDMQFQISDFITISGKTQKFHILGWTFGAAAGRTIHIFNRLVDNQIGYLEYNGLELNALTNLEVSLSINDGSNPPPVPLEDSHFKENFLVVIGSNYYAIAAINGAHLTLIGPTQDWKTLTAGGTAVTFNVYRYVRQPQTIQGMKFEYIDRRGKEIITNSIDPAQVLGMVPPEFLFAQLNKPGNQVVDAVTQGESIGFTIEYADGTQEQGEL